MAIQRYAFNPKTQLMERHAGGSWIEHFALAKQREGIAEMVEKRFEDDGTFEEQQDIVYAIRAFGQEVKPAHFEWQCHYCGAKHTEQNMYCPCGGMEP